MDNGRLMEYIFFQKMSVNIGEMLSLAVETFANDRKISSTSWHHDEPVWYVSSESRVVQFAFSDNDNLHLYAVMWLSPIGAVKKFPSVLSLDGITVESLSKFISSVWEAVEKL